MNPAWSLLNEQDRAAFRTAVAFLDKRLAEPKTVDWALRLASSQRVEHLAIEYLLDGPSGHALEEPWATAWRLIEESWSVPTMAEEPSISIYGVQARLVSGDRSGAMVSKIVALVAAHLAVEPVDSLRWQFTKKPRRPTTFAHLLYAKLSSGELVDLNILGLAKIHEVPFLTALGKSLESSVNEGLGIARRLGWSELRGLWQLGDLRRVYYVSNEPRSREDGDPDAFNRGIAPSVKLLYAVVARIAELDRQAALPFVRRWRLAQSPVDVRLWAAAARSPELVDPEAVGDFICGLDDRHFWNLHVFPEIAELRARRFGELDVAVQKSILKRLRAGPPRNHWPKKADAVEVKGARLYWAIRELRRIEVAGGKLPPSVHKWIESRIGPFADLGGMDIDAGFPSGSEVRSVPPNPDEKYDVISGAARLRALEAAFSASRNGWDDDPAERANDWLREPRKPLLVLGDLEGVGNGGDEFSRVWNRFGWAHSPKPEDVYGPTQRDLQGEADRVLTLLNFLSDGTLAAAIEGVSAWLDTWEHLVVDSALGPSVWQKIWPIAVEITNSAPSEIGEADLGTTARASNDDREPMDLDTLNTPAGKLVGVFLAACPALTEVPDPFANHSIARQMRDAVISATGRSGLIARRRLIESLPYFLNADQGWTQQQLIAPLMNDDGVALALWRGIARRTQFTEVLKIIGGPMADRASDRRLGRETRRRLVFSLIVESLYSFEEGREPAVPNPRIQQMLRMLDDEVRAYAADAIKQFVQERSAAADSAGAQAAPTAADIFRIAAAPLLQQVWPQERSLATPGVSSALADLPAASEEAFAEAVDAIERFLVPFECWSMLDYGLFGDANESGEKKLTAINTEDSARALLRLLDLTVGSSEGSVIPYDLTDALDQIRSVAPELSEDPVYRRLAAATRR